MTEAPKPGASVFVDRSGFVCFDRILFGCRFTDLQHGIRAFREFLDGAIERVEVVGAFTVTTLPFHTDDRTFWGRYYLGHHRNKILTAGCCIVSVQVRLSGRLPYYGILKESIKFG